MSAAGAGVGHFKDRVLDFDEIEMRFVPLVVEQPQALAIRNRDESAVIHYHVFLRSRIAERRGAADHFIAVFKHVTPDGAASL